VKWPLQLIQNYDSDTHALVFLCAFAPLREICICERNNSRKGAKAQRKAEEGIGHALLIGT
jgi:hypothetical protein